MGVPSFERRKHRHIGLGDVLVLAEERDRCHKEQVPFAARYESLPVGPEYRLVDTLKGLSPSVTLRDLIEREGEGT